MTIVFVTRRAMAKYLTLTGYMFEQSIPLRGIPYAFEITAQPTEAWISRCVQSAAEYERQGWEE